MNSEIRLRGIERWITDGNGDAMREVARLASRRGINEPELARRFGGSKNAKNVRDHFEGKARPSTVQRYFEILGLHEQYARLLTGEALPPAELASWRAAIEFALRQITTKFESASTVDEALAALDALSPGQNARVIGSYALAAYREHAGLYGLGKHVLDRAFIVPRLGIPLSALANALRPTFDLQSRIRAEARSDALLFDVWLAVHRELPDLACEIVLDVVRGLYRLDGGDLAPLERHLAEARAAWIADVAYYINIRKGNHEKS